MKVGDNVSQSEQEPSGELFCAVPDTIPDER